VACASDVPLETVGDRWKPLGSDGVWTKRGPGGAAQWVRTGLSVGRLVWRSCAVGDRIGSWFGLPSLGSASSPSGRIALDSGRGWQQPGPPPSPSNTRCCSMVTMVISSASSPACSRIQSRPARLATAARYRQLGTVPQVAPLGEYGSAHGRGPGNDAGVGGPACSGCGHVDRLIT
jgi:hypothetical protein